MKFNGVTVLRVLLLLLVLAGVAYAAIFIWKGQLKENAPEREAASYASRFMEVATGAAEGALRDFTILPAAIASRTPQEQEDFVRKALRDEISEGGLAILVEEGTFGPLAEVFPEDFEKWATALNVDPTACVAFRLDKGAIRAELVLRKDGTYYRIVRCNNVAQLAL